MKRAVLALLLAACGGPPFGEPGVRVTAGVRSVELGRGFPLTVVRTWPAGEEPPAVDLRPLRTRLLESERRERDGLVEERRRLLAYAFSPGRLARPVALDVRSALDADDTGAAELPEPPERTRWPWWLLLVLLPALALTRRRRRRPPAPAPAAEPDRRDATLERLRAAAGPLEIAAALRAYAGAETLTTEELAGREPRLAALLAPCDLVKFARHVPSAAEVEHLKAEAIGLIEES